MDMVMVPTKRQLKVNQRQFDQLQDYWAKPIPQVMGELGVSLDGLTTDNANACRENYGPNILLAKKNTSILKTFLLQFKNPFIDLLLFAAIASYFLQDPIDGTIIVVIILISSGLDLFQEARATDAVEKLLSLIQTTVQIQRDGDCAEIRTEDVVPGDIVFLSAGKNVPGDSLLIDSKDLFLNEATLTGEAFPVREKIRSLAR